MSNIQINPWELGDDIQGTSIPHFAEGTHILAKLAHPKNKTVRDGLVGYFIMTSFIDEYGKKVDLIEATESPDGYQIKFPLGKRGLLATKFRGPQNNYKFVNPKTNKWFQIPKERFTPEYASEFLSSKRPEWESLADIEKEGLIDEYLQDMFMFGLSQDLLLPATESGDFTRPVVGVKTKLYRVSTPADETKGEKYPNIKITKWEKGKPSLDGEFELVSEDLASAIYAEYSRRDEDTFDPSTFTETPKDDNAPF